jgi:zeta-carotene desaturase
MPSVVIVGGGLAGMAAGTALTDAGLRITLLERKPYLGGRASSYEHPGTGEVVDNCQHVLLGCCTNLIGFYGRIRAERLIRWYDRLTFLAPGGGRSIIGTSWLPAPLHSLASFLGVSALSWRDKLAIAQALKSLLPRLPEDDGRPFSHWLQARRQTRGAIEHFWKVILVSALNEDLERISLPAAALVFRESFLKSAQGGRMGVPRVPLTELYSHAQEYIRAHGGAIELRKSVEEFEPVGERSPEKAVSGMFASRAGVRLCVDGQLRMFDYAILAVPFDALARLLPRTPESESLRAQLALFQTSPITGVHLWFDRQITDLEHAVLLDRTIQWMFHKSKILDGRPKVGDSGNGERGTGNGERLSGSYLELVISSAKALVEKPRQEIIDLAVRELGEFFPAAREATLLKATVVKEVHATFSPLPGSDAYRPTAETPWPRVFLAGDWIATGWPATMESAVRGGYLAAEALCRATGRNDRFLVPDLPPTGLMRLIASVFQRKS